MTSIADEPSLTSNLGKRTKKMASNQSLNHLLNFSLPPRQTHAMGPLPRRGRKPGSAYPVWNKERFVNAQYRFVMHPAGDYTVHFADPDIFFQWPDILQVIIPRYSALTSTHGGSNDENGLTTCPICLSVPSAPRMTKCGHVFCFHCILHYLSTSDNKWARCPICFDSVNEKQLKSVKWFDGAIPDDDPSHASASSSSSIPDTGYSDEPKEGTSILMRLMQRPQISTLALPRSHTWPSDLLPPHQAPFHFLPDVYNFSKFMLATPEYLMEGLTRDLNELASERRLLANTNDDLSVSFVDAAEEKVLRQIAWAETLETPQLRDSIDKAHRDLREIQSRVAYHERVRKEHDSRNSSQDTRDARTTANSAESVSISETSLPPNRSAPRQRRNLNPPPPSTSTYYYYQAASGLSIFLHPLDIRILLAHFSGYAAFPETITVRVESAVQGSVNDDLRKRCKYLAHLPESSDVVFIEADLEGVVGEAGLKNFEGALRTRKNKRKEKEKKDDRARARAEGRERERTFEAAATWTFSGSTPAPPDPSPTREAESNTASTATNALSPPGAWGSRSFASALHSSSAQLRAQRPAAPTPSRDDDDWDVDAAWLDLEQRGGGRQKRRNKMLVLGGGGGGARRR